MTRGILIGSLLPSLVACGLVADSAAALDRERCMRISGIDGATKENACGRVIERAGSDRALLSQAHAHRAIALTWQRRLPAALRDAARAIELAPDDPLAYTARGVVLSEQEAVEAAVRDFEEAARLAPRDAEMMLNLAIATQRLGRREQALHFVERALLLAPGHANALAERCWINATLNRSLAQARADCDERLARYPQDANAYNSRGLVRFRAGDFDAAIADYNLAIAGDPSVGSSFYVRGLAKRALGNTGEGDSDIARGLALEPGVAERYRSFGVVPVSE